VQTQADKSPSPLLWIMTTTVILLSTAGFAALMAWMPAPTGASRDILPVSSSEREKPGAAMDEATLPVKRTATRKLKCRECGLIESIRETARQGEAILLTAADGPAGESRNGTAAGSAAREITVRLDDGSNRVIVDMNPARWRLGERVSVIDGLGEPTR
jgi:hypothetical protein